MNNISVTPVNISTSASMLAQVSARPNQFAGESDSKQAGATQKAVVMKEAQRPDMLANLKALEAQIAERAKQARDVNLLDISYNKREALLSVKVEQKETGDLVRELQFKDYKAMVYSKTGFKGVYLDMQA